MALNKPALTPFWLVLWSCALAIGWLLPNHYWPWLSFHSDAWVALTASLATLALIWRSNGPTAWHRLSLLAAALMCVPCVQFASGMMPIAGNLWISLAYLAGLLMALLSGARWESSTPGQLGDGLFLAIGIAALLSVGLQLQQWLQLDGIQLWTMGGGPSRPHANFGQPNQLATFLLWGLLASGWGLIRKYIGIRTALLTALYLLFGIALTGSRTAWLGVALLVGACLLWRRLWGNPRVSWAICGLGLYFMLCVAALGWWQVFSQGNLQTVPHDITRISGEMRPLAWTMLLDAVRQRPWFGYGWNQVALAHMAVASEFAPLHQVFTYSHNLFLDLVLWCGIPLGLLTSIALVWWLLKRLYAVQNAENAILLLFLLLLANHAMFELPLYYAYFLLPAGLIMGSLHTRLDVRPVLLIGRWVLFVFWFGATTLLVTIIRDYTHIEPSYQTLRMEWARIKITMPVGPPDVILLTQWRDYIKFARVEPKPGITAGELEWMRNVTGLYPSAILIHKMASVLALNQRPEEAQRWLKKLCKVAAEEDCLTAKTIWSKQSLQYPSIAAVAWPD
jgi:O-antigen ligase